MQLFGGLFRTGLRADAAPARRDPSDDTWFEPRRGRRVAAGVEVTVERARQVPVIRDCLQVLSSTIAGLSFSVFRREADDSRNKVTDHPIARLLRDPNPRQTSFEFIASLVDDLGSHGEFFAELVWEGARSTFPRYAYRFDPRWCEIEELGDRSRRLKVREPGRPERTLVEGEFWYIPLPPMKDNLRGRSPIIDDGRETIGAAIALQDYANAFFGNDATPPFIFLHDGQFADEDSKKNFLGAWQRWFGGRNRHRPGVLEYGIKVEKLGTTNEQAQFLETRKELWLDCTRLYRMPPHKVGLMEQATFSNIEHQSLEFVVDTIGPWLELIERSIGKWLIDDESAYFEFNVSSLLRGDIKTRFEAYSLGRQWGWFSINEIRKLENMNGIGAAGDRYMTPLNMREFGAGAAPQPLPEDQGRVDQAIAFLRQSVAINGGRPKLEVISNAA